MSAENISITRLRPERASNAFTSHNRGSRGETADISVVLELGDLEGCGVQYETTAQKHWIQIHEQDSSESESFRHVRLKIVLADFLYELGHDVARPLEEWEQDEWRVIDRDIAYTCFERRYSNGRADVAYFDSGFHIIGEAGKCSAKKLIGGGVDADNAVFLLLPYEWMEFETERSKPVMDISEIDEPISAASAFPARFDITAEIVAFIRPDEDLADCLYP
jgi:hypothetical protein